MALPETVKIIDRVYTIEYVDNPAEVDIYKRESLWGQVDYWTRSIRIYSNSRKDADVWQTLWHEILHALAETLHIETRDGELRTDEKNIDLLATGINTILHDNDFLRKT